MKITVRMTAGNGAFWLIVDKNGERVLTKTVSVIDDPAIAFTICEERYVFFLKDRVVYLCGENNSIDGVQIFVE